MLTLLSIARTLSLTHRQKKKVVLFDATGAEVTSLTVPDPAAEFLYDEAAETPVAALAWHPSGSHLAVLPRGQTFAMVWSPTGGTARVDSGVKVRGHQGGACIQLLLPLDRCLAFQPVVASA